MADFNSESTDRSLRDYHKEIKLRIFEDIIKSVATDKDGVLRPGALFDSMARAIRQYNVKQPIESAKRLVTLDQLKLLSQEFSFLSRKYIKEGASFNITEKLEERGFKGLVGMDIEQIADICRKIYIDLSTPPYILYFVTNLLVNNLERVLSGEDISGLVEQSDSAFEL